MSERTILLDDIDPVDIYGVNDQNINFIKGLFPKLKIIARGNKIKVVGDKKSIHKFQDKFEKVLKHYDRYQSITVNDLEQIMAGNMSSEEIRSTDPDDVIVYGPNGLLVRARTPNQRKIVDSINENDMLFAIGPAGTGKTYTAVATAVNYLKNRKVRRIILTRPAVEAGESLGFLPGDLKEKLDPYLQPLYDALREMLPPDKLRSYIETGVIQIAPLAFMRGRTLDHAFVILDEAQNATESQLKMFLTRMGKSAKFIITGDVTQVDLPRHQPSGLVQAVKLLSKIKGIDFIALTQKDVVRHDLVTRIIQAYDKSDIETKSKDNKGNKKQ